MGMPHATGSLTCGCTAEPWRRAACITCPSHPALHCPFCPETPRPPRVPRPARLYHVREPETQVLQLAFPEFVKCSAAWRARRLYMRVRGGVGGGCPQVLGLRAAAVCMVVAL